MDSQEESGLVGGIGDRTFTLLFGAAYLALLVGLIGKAELRRAAAVAATGAAYVAIGTRGFAWVERRGRLGLAVAYFAAQLGLGVVITRLTGGEIGSILLLLLLCGQSVPVLRRPWLVGLCVVLVTGVLVFAPAGIIPWPYLLHAGFGLLAASLFMVTFARLIADERQQRADLDLANRQLRRFAVQVEQLATIQERNRLAREIHDGLGHYLSVINMQIQGALAVINNDPARAEATLAKAQTLTREALADVRHSVATLRTVPTERDPLPQALASLVEESNASGLAATLVVSGEPRAISPQADLALFRAAQEGLTNVRRHAQANRAALELDYRDPAAVRLAVRDDGVGARTTDGGFGLLGLRERVQLLGGRVDIRTAPGQGLHLSVEAPG